MEWKSKQNEQGFHCSISSGSYAEIYSKLCETSKMELFLKILSQILLQKAPS